VVREVYSIVLLIKINSYINNYCLFVQFVLLLQKKDFIVMSKRLFFFFVALFCLHFQAFSLDAFIRINQLGYTPNGIKRAILISESKITIKSFSIYDALTEQKLADFYSVIPNEPFQQFSSVYTLDFSSFRSEGAFYIKADYSFSPTIYIDKNSYRGAADFLLNYLRQQRCGFNPTLNAYCHQHDGYEVPQKPIPLLSAPQTKKVAKNVSALQLPTEIDALGGWHNASNNIKYGATSAAAVFQLLYAYRMNPAAFGDSFDANGLPFPNKIPDVLDEAKWGLDWLLKMNPNNEVLYFQVADDRDDTGFVLPTNDKVDYGWGAGKERPVYRATGKPEGLFDIKNRSTGVASIAGKYASAFALGSDMLRAFYPVLADTLENRAYSLYNFGKKYPGVCQSAPAKSKLFLEEDNWADDMQLAATQLYQLSFESKFQTEAAAFGRLEPIIPWLFSDTVNHYQWFPFTNYGHFVLANSEKPEIKEEFLQNIRFGLKRAELRKGNNPFGVGVPMVWGSNNYVTALATQCNLYRRYSGDSTFIGMETALLDWLFGCNPWGVSMVVGLPQSGQSPARLHSAFTRNKGVQQKGALVAGPVRPSVFSRLYKSEIRNDKLARFQTKWAVYHDEFSDSITNQPTIDGTASLVYLLGAKQFEENRQPEKNRIVEGGIVQTDRSKKQISLVFTGHEYADGMKKIRKALRKNDINAAFFFTGDFLRKRKFKSYVKVLKKDGHYIGAHSDQYLQYCQVENRSSLLLDRSLFVSDLQENYIELAKFGIQKSDAQLFVPPYELYNDTISKWCKEMGLTLVNVTPGTRSNADNTFPEMREKYFSSEEIYSSIIKMESAETLNGSILLFHVGTDPRRTDKFYNRLNELIGELKRKGYEFTELKKAIY